MSRGESRLHSHTVKTERFQAGHKKKPCKHMDLERCSFSAQRRTSSEVFRKEVVPSKMSSRVLAVTSISIYTFVHLFFILFTCAGMPFGRQQGRDACQGKTWERNGGKILFFGCIRSRHGTHLSGWSEGWQLHPTRPGKAITWSLFV